MLHCVRPSFRTVPDASGPYAPYISLFEPLSVCDIQAVNDVYKLDSRSTRRWLWKFGGDAPTAWIASEFCRPAMERKELGNYRHCLLGHIDIIRGNATLYQILYSQEDWVG